MSERERDCCVGRLICGWRHQSDTHGVKRDANEINVHLRTVSVSKITV